MLERCLEGSLFELFDRERLGISKVLYTSPRGVPVNWNVQPLLRIWFSVQTQDKFLAITKGECKPLAISISNINFFVQGFICRK